MKEKNISKNRKSVLTTVDLDKNYNLEEAIDLVKSITKAKFNETIDIALNLNINLDKSDQSIRGVVNLPHGSGKKLRIAVIAKGDKAIEAKNSGADIVGDTDLLKTIEEGKVDFDRLISTPDMMKEVGKLGQILGPKGLMPNPKLGTVTNDINKAVNDNKKGQVQYRNDKGGQVHAGIGKINFEKTQLVENIKVFYQEIVKSKPDSVKGSFIKRVSIASTMGFGIKLNLGDLQK